MPGYRVDLYRAIDGEYTEVYSQVGGKKSVARIVSGSGLGWRPVIVVGALILGLCSACGSSSKSAAPTNTTASPSGVTPGSTGSTGNTGSAAACPSSTGVTPTDVKVGVLFDQTGPNAPGGWPFGAGVEARFAVQNKQIGGINGRKIVAVNADTQSSPGNGLQPLRASWKATVWSV